MVTINRDKIRTRKYDHTYRACRRVIVETRVRWKRAGTRVSSEKMLDYFLKQEILITEIIDTKKNINDLLLEEENTSNIGPVNVV